MTEDAYYRDRFVPKGDRALWVVEVAGREPLRLRLGAGREPIPSDPTVRVEHLSGVNLTVRSITAVAFTPAQLGRKPFKAGDALPLRSTFWTHGRCYRMDWNGVFVLAK